MISISSSRSTYGPAIPSNHDASYLAQIKHGLEIVHVSCLNFACRLTSNVGGFKSHDSKASTCFSHGSSKSWLRYPRFEAYRKISRKLLMRNLIVVLGLTFHVKRCSLARATGPVFSHGSFYLANVNGRLRVRGGQISGLSL